MLLKQPNQGNVVTQFLPKKLKLKLKDGERRPMSEMYGFLSGGLTTLICDEASMLAASIRKMFQLCMLAYFTWKNVLHVVTVLYKITVLKGDGYVCKHAKSMLKVSGLFFIASGVLN